MFEEIISAGIVSIIALMLLVTLPGEAPLKRLLSKPSISRLFYYYATSYLTFSVILLFWTICNWGWKSITYQNYSIINRLEKRITKLLLLIILSIPSRYILRLMSLPSTALHNADNQRLQTINEKLNVQNINSHQRVRSVPLIQGQSPHKSDLKNLIFGSEKTKTTTKTKTTPFQALERSSTLHYVSKWTPLPSEVFEIAGLFKLFARVRLHGRHHIPRNKPCVIVVNHALGHGFDVPMMVYVLRKYCRMPRVRVLVSAKHFNYPIWCDMVYYLGGVPRTHQVTEHLMQNGENIIIFAAKKKKTSMIWDNTRRLYLDLVHKYDYMLVPAVCVSDDDVIDMVYNFSSPKKKMNQGQSVQYDTDTDEEEEKEQTFDIIKNRLRKGYRKQYHLRFSEAIGVPKGDKRGRKSRKSTEKMDDDEDLDYDENDSQTSSKSSRIEVRFSGIHVKHSTESNSDDDSKYNDMESIDFSNTDGLGRKRRWSRELEVGLKNAVEDAMTDGISEMYNKLKNDPHSSLLQTMQTKMNIMWSSPAPSDQYNNSLREDLRRSESNELRSKGKWME